MKLRAHVDGAQLEVHGTWMHGLQRTAYDKISIKKETIRIQQKIVCF